MPKKIDMDFSAAKASVRREMKPIIEFAHNANYAESERRILLWEQMRERMGGSANQVGDHDPDYVPPYRGYDHRDYMVVGTVTGRIKCE